MLNNNKDIIFYTSIKNYKVMKDEHEIGEENIDKCIEVKTGSKPELILENKEIIHPNIEILDEIMALFKIINE